MNPCQPSQTPPGQPRRTLQPGVPLVGPAAGMLVLGEVVSAWQWAGTALVAAALGCVMLGGLIKRS